MLKCLDQGLDAECRCIALCVAWDVGLMAVKKLSLQQILSSDQSVKNINLLVTGLDVKAPTSYKTFSSLEEAVTALATN
ncbi:MAG: hypothetical protein R3A13_05830 [Bdellovibrionota bacterium]